MKAVLVTAPTLEPVSVPEVKDHLRVDHNYEDELIANLVASCREQVEQITNRAIMTQTWDYHLDRFPDKDYIALPFGNLQSVTHVKHKDSSGVETTMTVSTEYLVETNGERHGRIVLPYGVTWPSGPFYPSNPITIRFVCGWTSALLVPKRIKQAIKLLCAAQYEARGDAYTGQMTVTEDQTAENLLWNERLWGTF
jgi:uncharacterized phiE125 gp8 family phage protein